MVLLGFCCILAAIFGKLAWMTALLVMAVCLVFDIFIGRRWYPWPRA